MTLSDVVRSFRVVMDGIESTHEEIRLTYNRRTIARVIPESAERTALEVFGDLYRTLDHGTGDALARAVESAKRSGRNLVAGPRFDRYPLICKSVNDEDHTGDSRRHLPGIEGKSGEGRGHAHQADRGGSEASG